MSTSPPIKGHWYGQSGIRLVSPNGKVILIDPWFDCPTNPNKATDFERLGPVDLLLLSHGHFDHSADIVRVAKAARCPLVTVAELADALIQYKDFPTDLPIHRGRTGSRITLLDGELTVEFIKAVHESSLNLDDGTKVKTGDPVGFILEFAGGPTILDSADTDLYPEMNDLAARDIDFAIMCIGGYYTFGPDGAAEAVRRMQPKMVMPQHYASLPVLTGTPAEFEAEMRKLGLTTPMINPQPGDDFVIQLKGD